MPWILGAYKTFSTNKTTKKFRQMRGKPRRSLFSPRRFFLSTKVPCCRQKCRGRLILIYCQPYSLFFSLSVDCSFGGSKSTLHTAHNRPIFPGGFFVGKRNPKFPAVISCAQREERDDMKVCNVCTSSGIFYLQRN